MPYISSTGEELDTRLRRYTSTGASLHPALPSLRSPPAANAGAGPECIPKHLERPRKRSCPQSLSADGVGKLLERTYYALDIGKSINCWVNRATRFGA